MDWYRNAEWSDSIAAAFEERLGRARQKAQYLSLQGQALIAAHPAAAAALLERAVALDDPTETGRALGYLAQARLACRDVEGALATYEKALGRQLRQPNIVGAAPADYAFAVGYFRRHERLAAALPIVEALPADSVFGPDLQVLAAKAMILAMAGRDEEAGSAARAALPLLEFPEEAEALGIGLSDLRDKLAAIAAWREHQDE